MSCHKNNITAYNGQANSYTFTKRVKEQTKLVYSQSLSNLFESWLAPEMLMHDAVREQFSIQKILLLLFALYPNIDQE